MNAIEESVSPLFTYKGITVLDTNHCVSRFVERHKEISINFFYERIRETIDKIISLHGRKENVYMAVSKSTRLKFPIHYRPDRKNPKAMAGIIPTVLDKVSNPKNLRNEIIIMVEKEGYEIIGVE